MIPEEARLEGVAGTTAVERTVISAADGAIERLENINIRVSNIKGALLKSDEPVAKPETDVPHPILPSLEEKINRVHELLSSISFHIEEIEMKL